MTPTEPGDPGPIRTVSVRQGERDAERRLYQSRKYRRWEPSLWWRLRSRWTSWRSRRAYRRLIAATKRATIAQQRLTDVLPKDPWPPLEDPDGDYPAHASLSSTPVHRRHTLGGVDQQTRDMAAGDRPGREQTLQERILHDFTHHPPLDLTRQGLHESVRAELLRAAERLVRLTPPGREQSLALTRLEEAMFWANAAIGRQAPAEPVNTDAEEHNAAYTPRELGDERLQSMASAIAAALQGARGATSSRWPIDPVISVPVVLKVDLDPELVADALDRAIRRAPVSGSR